MGDPILGSEAIAAGTVSRGTLRWNYRTVFRDVYLPNDVTPSITTRAVGAWLWSHRRAVVTGRAAAALHGAKWVDDDTDVELLWTNNRAPRGIIARRERIADDEICVVRGVSIATPARTALDLGRHLTRDKAVMHLDALAQATGITAADVSPLIARYAGTRGIRLCRNALDLMDGGAQSPKETWLRLLLVDAGFPRPQTQIPVLDGSGYPFAFLDMGWEDQMIAVEYDGEEHRTDRARWRWDIRRLRKVLNLGWLHVKVIAGDRPYDIIERVREAWLQREREVTAAIA